jgi:hypothetical protein
MNRVANDCGAVKKFYSPNTPERSGTAREAPSDFEGALARRSPSPSPPLAKKKGSPHTPLKEKTQPLHIPVLLLLAERLELQNKRKRILLATSVMEGESFHKQRQQPWLAKEVFLLTQKGNPEQAEEIPKPANRNLRGEIPNQATSPWLGPNPHRSLPRGCSGGGRP